MDTVWTALTTLLAAWLGLVAIGSVVRGSQPRAVRLLRDGTAAALPLVGFLAFAVITGNLPPLLPAVGAFVVGIALGYLATWWNGSLPAFGRAIVWTSPWHMGLLALSGAIASVGALGGWEPVLAGGLLGLCAALGFGVGSFGFAIAAARDAQARFEEDLHVTVTCTECQREVRAGTRLCTQCGNPLLRHCPSCGSLLGALDAACEACGLPDKGRLPEPGPNDVAVRFCQACSIRVAMADNFCSSCGSLLAPACPLCGAPVMLDAEICGFCDVELGPAAAAVESGLLDSLVAEVDEELGKEEPPAAPEGTRPLVDAVTTTGPQPDSRRQFDPEKGPTQGSSMLEMGRYCGTCGTRAQPEAAFCTHCGNRL